MRYRPIEGKGIKAAFFLGCFIALPVVACVMVSQWALHLALPEWSLLLIAGGIMALGRKLADVWRASKSVGQSWSPSF